ncbi:MAG: hypothetical protein WKF52_00445 [Sphingomicrobium sp.]
MFEPGVQFEPYPNQPVQHDCDDEGRDHRRDEALRLRQQDVEDGLHLLHSGQHLARIAADELAVGLPQHAAVRRHGKVVAEPENVRLRSPDKDEAQSGRDYGDRNQE